MTTQDRAITLRDWEVRAVLNGATQIRRVVKPQPLACNEYAFLKDDLLEHAPYQPGQRLWVREEYGLNNETEAGIRAIAIHYKDGQTLYIRRDLRMRRPPLEVQWYPAITMPRWASRITLEVTSTGAGRVQEITYEDILAMGWDAKSSQPITDGTAGEDALAWAISHWNADNTKHPWQSNHWNWVYGVRRIE